ncbi:hypothetical protein WA158_004176 [Blastocystis sp. Blastoise]
MPAFNSQLNDPCAILACGCPILPLRSSVNGPAPKLAEGKSDFIDEAFDLFRANVLFSNFEIKTPADRTLTFCILYISRCLREIEKCSDAVDAQKILYMLSNKTLAVPGSNNYTLSKVFPAPENKKEADLYISYMNQIREEINNRIPLYIFKDGEWSKKWWMTFSKTNFMNLTLPLY